MPPATRARFRPQACDWQLLLLLSLDCDNFAACCDLRPALTLSRALCVLCDLPHRRPSIEEVGSLIVAQIMTQLEMVPGEVADAPAPAPCAAPDVTVHPEEGLS